MMEEEKFMNSSWRRFQSISKKMAKPKATLKLR
jgi:hypothetical protein